MAIFKREHEGGSSSDPTHLLILWQVGDLLLDDLGLVLGQEIQDGLRVFGVTDKGVLESFDNTGHC